MTQQDKAKLLKLITDSDIDGAIKGLLEMDLNQKQQDQIKAIASRHNQLKEDQRLGILSFDDLKRTQNQITVSLIGFINDIDKKETPPPAQKPSTQWKTIALALLSLALLVSLAEALNFIDLYPAPTSSNNPTKQPIDSSKMAPAKPNPTIVAKPTIKDTTKRSKPSTKKEPTTKTKPKPARSHPKKEPKPIKQVPKKPTNNAIPPQSTNTNTNTKQPTENIVTKEMPPPKSINTKTAKPATEVMQLTVFVTDTKGNVVLENEGRLNIPLGNRPLNENIGANGRTNFPDITANNKGDQIEIGLEAEGWEIVGKNTFTFTGNPIKLKVKRDEKLGVIKGIVKTRDGQEFLAGAKVLINTDTTIYTNANGVFKIVLPEKMRIKKVTDHYDLHINKEGYRTETLYYTPNTNQEVRLTKRP